MNEKAYKTIKCPQCGRLTSYSPKNSFRPFCSERCRLIDLGAWAEESYRIPVGGSSSDSLTSEYEDLESDDERDPESHG